MEENTRQMLNLYKMADIKKMLKERGSPVSGKKDELIERILPLLLKENSGQSGAAVGLLDEEAATVTPHANINESELDESALLGLDTDANTSEDLIDETPDTTISDEQKHDVSDVLVPTDGRQEEEIKTSIDKATTILHEAENKEAQKHTHDEVMDHHPQEGKKLKLDMPVSDEEKKKNRAERFGVVSPSTKEERAKRFAMSTAVSSSGSSTGLGLLSKDDRAKKFGVSSPTASIGVMSKEDRAKKFGLPLKDKNSVNAESKSNQLGLVSKEDRAKRFGSANSTETEGTPKILSDDAKRKRSERFGTENPTSRGQIKSDIKTDSELLNKRASRFGTAGVAKWESSSIYTSMTEEDKRKKRMEKFGM